MESAVPAVALMEKFMYCGKPASVVVTATTYGLLATEIVFAELYWRSENVYVSLYRCAGERLSIRKAASRRSGTRSPAPNAMYATDPGACDACIRWHSALQFLRRHAKKGVGIGVTIIVAACASLPIEYGTLVNTADSETSISPVGYG